MLLCMRTKRKKKRGRPEDVVYFQPDANYSLTRPHHAVKATKVALEPEQYGYGLMRSYGASIHAQVSKRGSQRLLWLLNQLLRKLEELGCSFEVLPSYDGGAFCRWEAEKVEILGKEKVRQFDNPEHDPNAHFLDRKPTFIYVPSGLMKLQIKDSHNIVSEWMDSPSQPLDQRIDEVAKGIIERMETIKGWKLEREEQARRDQVEQQRRWERQRLQEAENARLAELERQAASLTRCDEILTLIDQITTTAMAMNLGPMEMAKVNEWSSWAKKYADKSEASRKALRHILGG